MHTFKVELPEGLRTQIESLKAEITLILQDRAQRLAAAMETLQRLQADAAEIEQQSASLSADARHDDTARIEELTRLEVRSRIITRQLAAASAELEGIQAESVSLAAGGLIDELRLHWHATLQQEITDRLTPFFASADEAAKYAQGCLAMTSLMTGLAHFIRFGANAIATERSFQVLCAILDRALVGSPCLNFSGAANGQSGAVTELPGLPALVDPMAELLAEYPGFSREMLAAGQVEHTARLAHIGGNDSTVDDAKA